ncbi:MAG: hypothetical protein R3274_06370, partial [Desulfobacterales bacterium]|nr:hypothetical protein [Desulfobacterales bacterium]
MAEIKSINTKHGLNGNGKSPEIDVSVHPIQGPRTADKIKPRAADNICYMRERNINMLKNELILKNPLRRMGFESDDILNKGEFGAVMARAGVGKTAFLVQLALHSMLREKKVLHISLNDPVKKVSLWYKEVFSRITAHYHIQQSNQLWELVLPHRFIMTFRVEGFSVPKLEERLTDLIEQDIFTPDAIIMDGVPFEDPIQEDLTGLKQLAARLNLRVWFTIRTHRHEELKSLGILDPRWEISARDQSAPDWSDVGEQRWEDQRMAVYAAQVDRMDQGI